jgi:hypothetical protein
MDYSRICPCYSQVSILQLFEICSFHDSVLVFFFFCIDGTLQKTYIRGARMCIYLIPYK